MGLVEMKPEIARFVLLGDRGQADKRTRQTRQTRLGPRLFCVVTLFRVLSWTSKLQVSPLWPRRLFHSPKKFLDQPSKPQTIATSASAHFSFLVFMISHSFFVLLKSFFMLFWGLQDTKSGGSRPPIACGRIFLLQLRHCLNLILQWFWCLPP